MQFPKSLIPQGYFDVVRFRLKLVTKRAHSMTYAHELDLRCTEKYCTGDESKLPRELAPSRMLYQLSCNRISSPTPSCPLRNTSASH